MVYGNCLWKKHLPLTQANIIHSMADGVAPRFVGTSVSRCPFDDSSAQNQKLTTDSIRCDANINKTIFPPFRYQHWLMFQEKCESEKIEESEKWIRENG